MRFKIPKSWDDITIQQLYDMQRLDKADELQYLIDLVATLCNLDTQTVEGLTINQLREVSNKMAFIRVLPEKFVNDFKLNGTHYFVDCNISHISAGQYVDLNKYIEEGADENLHKILTVFCLPTKRKLLKRKPLKYGEGYDIKKVADDMLNAPVSVAYPLALFFCKLLTQSMPIIQASLEKEMNSLNKLMDKTKN